MHLEIAYPDAEGQLNRFMPLIKWLLAIPHYVILIILWNLHVCSHSDRLGSPY